MSPQPAAAPVETAADRQIARAEQLEFDRDELQKKIGKNRDYLRLMADNGELTEEQETWLLSFYPEKEKGERRSKDEIEQTRQVREAARKGYGFSTDHHGVNPEANVVDDDDDSDEDDD